MLSIIISLTLVLHAPAGNTCLRMMGEKPGSAKWFDGALWHPSAGNKKPGDRVAGFFMSVSKGSTDLKGRARFP
ncbi:hypothetical protein [Radicibacter daui]|uniref:hypothetical protein n=1 Tax=Radicibacter daui TaxID=3064829 RepID=UPI004046E9FE